MHTILDKLNAIEKQIAVKQKPFMNLSESAKYLGISKNTLYTYTSKCLLPFYKLHGRRVYFKVEDLDAFVFDKQFRVSSQKEIEQKADDWIMRNRYK